MGASANLHFTPKPTATQYLMIQSQTINRKCNSFEIMIQIESIQVQYFHIRDLIERKKNCSSQSSMQEMSEY